MTVVKATRKIAKAKKAKKERNKPPKPKITTRMIYEIVAETLQNNSDGEFDLPSVIVKYLDKSHPKYRLGAHREYYVPAGKPIRYFYSDTPQAEMIYHNQASIILPAIIGEGIPIKEYKFDLKFCKECE